MNREAPSYYRFRYGKTVASRWIFPHTRGYQECAGAGLQTEALAVAGSRTVTEPRAGARVTRGYRFAVVPGDRCGGGNP